MALRGGNVADSVVLVEATVRKPVTAATPAVEALLNHLGRVGFRHAPRWLGRDESGRQVLEYVPGMIAEAMPAMTLPELRRVGAVIREFHDASASFRAPAGARWEVAIAPDREDLICHHDLAPWNLVRDGRRWVFIDWDGAGPGSRLWDLGYAVQSFVPLCGGGDPVADAPRVRAMADGYGLDEADRRALPAVIAAHTRGMFELLRQSATTGRQPWARLYAQGHGDHWRAAAEYVEAHLDRWATALVEGQSGRSG